MKTWLVEPRDPLIARDGRPFRAEPGARARTIPFPLPSTIAGAFRSRAGGDPFDVRKLPDLVATPVHGPWLVELRADDRVHELYLPAPADITYELCGERDDDNATIRLHRLAPVAIPEGCQTNLPAGLSLPVGLDVPFSGKAPRPPTFFRWSHYSAWLEGQLPSPSEVIKSELGLSLDRDTRIHVAVETGRRTAVDEALFLTEGLSFESLERRLALVARTSLDLDPGVARVGGESRLAAFRRTAFDLPQCPDALLDDVVQKKACRLLLVTPGLFRGGFLPGLTRISNARASIVAAAVSSAGTVSGFDLANSRPKPTRRFAPAGSVYFVRFETADESLIREWVNAHWFASVSDDEQDQRDGWGLAVLGSWDGKAVSRSEATS